LSSIIANRHSYLIVQDLLFIIRLDRS